MKFQTICNSHFKVFIPLTPESPGLSLCVFEQEDITTFSCLVVGSLPIIPFEILDSHLPHWSYSLHCFRYPQNPIHSLPMSRESTYIWIESWFVRYLDPQAISLTWIQHRRSK